jgi:benzil reductase ((S)-benzoin forming)
MPLNKDVLILITGCNRGLGKELFRRFSESFEVVGLNRSLCQETDILIDLADQDIDLKKISTLVSLYKKVIFINNASIINPIKPIAEITLAEIDESIRVNFINPAKIIKTIISSNKCFSVINLTSGAAFTKNEALSLYSATKAAMHRFIDILEKENENNTNCLMVVNYDPGRMQTDMQANLLREKNIASDAISNFTLPKDVANEIFNLVKRTI